MNETLIKGTIEDTDKAIAWLERVKYRMRIWSPENDPSEFLSRADAAEFMGISYRTVGQLTKLGILKPYGEGRQKLYFRSKCLQALRDNASWKHKASGHKKPRPKRSGLVSLHNRGNKKRIRTRLKIAIFRAIRQI